MRPGERWWCWGLAAIAAASPARGAGPLGPAGAPIQTSSYAIDFFQGPVLDTVRVSGLAGAYAPIAEGVEGMRASTAASAVRSLHSFRRFDYDLSLSLTSPGSLRETDFDNDGVVGFRYQNFYFAEFGGLLQYGPWGGGLDVSLQRYTLGAPREDATRQLDVVLSRGVLQVARSFLDGELVVGAGLRLASLGLETSLGGEETRQLVEMSGAGVEAGALWKPGALPLRVALSARSAVAGRVVPGAQAAPDANGDLQIEGRYLPTTLQLPWEVEGGVAYQLGARPLNLPWPLTREQYQALPRGKALLTSSLLVSGPVAQAVGVESFLAQQVARSGQRVTLTPRVGLETEPIEGWMQVRVGSYLEPSRYPRGHARLHGTFGLENKLFPWTVFGLFPDDTWWRISSFVDLSPRYVSWGFSAGVWH